jgi:hypothetical protein
LSISPALSAPTPNGDPKPMPGELAAVANPVSDVAQPAGMPNFTNPTSPVTFAGIDPRTPEPQIQPAGRTPLANCEEPNCEAPATPDYVPNQNVPADTNYAPDANQPNASCSVDCGAPAPELTEPLIAPASAPGGMPYATGLAAPQPVSPSPSIRPIPSPDQPFGPAFAATPKAS